jgi:Spy/CpxP family protein refolding chaperone
MSLKSVAATVSALIGLGAVAAWWANAETSHEQVRTNQEQIQKLTDIAERQQTLQEKQTAVDEAEQKQLWKLCAAKRLDRAYCIEKGIEVPE